MRKFDPEEISSLIRSRRSVFPPQYSGETISREIIEQILENANWAPTHKLTEPWRFTVFTGEGLKTLATFMSELYKEETMKDGSFDETKYNGLKTKPLQASHIISIGMKRDSKNRLPEIEEIESVACAVQNMCLTATAYGIGGYWGSGGVTYFENAKPFFNLEPEDKLLGFLYMGISKSSPAPGRRKPISEKVRWVEK
jgi:nitroreductase